MRFYFINYSLNWIVLSLSTDKNDVKGGDVWSDSGNNDELFLDGLFKEDSQEDEIEPFQLSGLGTGSYFFMAGWGNSSFICGNLSW